MTQPPSSARSWGCEDVRVCAHREAVDLLRVATAANVMRERDPIGFGIRPLPLLRHEAIPERPALAEGRERVGETDCITSRITPCSEAR